MKQNQPYIVTIHQLDHDLAGAVNPWKRRKPLVAKTPPDPESDRIPQKTACPDNRNEGAKIKRFCAGGITGKKREQQAVRSGERENQAVSRITVQTQQLKERRKIGWKNQ